MPATILPETCLTLLGAWAPCVPAPSYQTFVTLVAGWVQCLGRRTVTGVVLAAGAASGRQSAVAHRCFRRARWSLDALGRVLVGLAVRWGDPEQPLIVIVDDTLGRKGGQGIRGATMRHDPLRSTRRTPCVSVGHGWVVRARWVPLPLGERRGCALPVRFRL